MSWIQSIEIARGPWRFAFLGLLDNALVLADHAMVNRFRVRTHTISYDTISYDLVRLP